MGNHQNSSVNAGKTTERFGGDDVALCFDNISEKSFIFWARMECPLSGNLKIKASKLVEINPD